MSPDRPPDHDLQGCLETSREIVLDRAPKHLSRAPIAELACVAASQRFRNTMRESLHILFEAALLPHASSVKLA